MIHKNNIHKNNIHKNNIHKNNIHENNIHKNNIDKNNIHKNNIHKNNIHKNNIDKNNIHKNNIHKNNIHKNNISSRETWFIWMMSHSFLQHTSYEWHLSCIISMTTRPYESCKILKGRPHRNAFSKLVHRQYKSFPSDRFCLVEMKNPTRLSNKTNNAWSCAEDQILENWILRNIILNVCTER